MCWSYDTTKKENPSKVWKTGYTVKHVDANGCLCNLWNFGGVGFYVFSEVLTSTDAAARCNARDGNFGFNIFPSEKAATAFLGKEWNRMVDVVVKCKYRFVTRSCTTVYGKCVAAKEMKLVKVLDNPTKKVICTTKMQVALRLADATISLPPVSEYL